MSIEAVLGARRGLVVAPAGCGKTHLITEVLSVAQHKPYLVLTHTTAGVTALKKRLKRFSVPSQNYVVTTIDGWALRIAGSFPGLCPVDVGPEVPNQFYPRFGDQCLRCSGRVISMKPSELPIHVCWSMNTRTVMFCNMR